MNMLCVRAQIIVEFCEGGSLYSLIHSSKKMTATEKMNFAKVRCAHVVCAACDRPCAGRVGHRVWHGASAR
jgi:hypothetical protein